MYNSSDFKNEGIQVHDLEFPDGGNPFDYITQKFILLCQREIEKG